jgi:hypothetical protein
LLLCKEALASKQRTNSSAVELVPHPGEPSVLCRLPSLFLSSDSKMKRKRSGARTTSSSSISSADSCTTNPSLLTSVYVKQPSPSVVKITTNSVEDSMISAFAVGLETVRRRVLDWRDYKLIASENAIAPRSPENQRKNCCFPVIFRFRHKFAIAERGKVFAARPIKHKNYRSKGQTKNQRTSVAKLRFRSQTMGLMLSKMETPR